MSEGQAASRPSFAFWKLAVSAVPAGIAVVVFLAIRWPFDLVAPALLAGLAVVTSGWMRRPFWHVALLYAFVFLAMLVVAGAYLASSVYQTWLPVPALAGLAMLAALCALAWIGLSTRGAPPAQASSGHSH